MYNITAFNVGCIIKRTDEVILSKKIEDALICYPHIFIKIEYNVFINYLGEETRKEFLSVEIYLKKEFMGKKEQCFYSSIGTFGENFVEHGIFENEFKKQFNMEDKDNEIIRSSILTVVQEYCKLHKIDIFNRE